MQRQRPVEQLDACGDGPGAVALADVHADLGRLAARGRTGARCAPGCAAVGPGGRRAWCRRARRTGAGGLRRPPRSSSAGAGSDHGHHRRPRPRPRAKRCANASRWARPPAHQRRSGEGRRTAPLAEVESERPLEAGTTGRGRRAAGASGRSWCSPSGRRLRVGCAALDGQEQSLAGSDQVGSAPMTLRLRAVGAATPGARRPAAEAVPAGSCSPGQTARGSRRAGPRPAAGARRTSRLSVSGGHGQPEPGRMRPVPERSRRGGHRSGPRPRRHWPARRPRPASNARRTAAGQPRRAVRAGVLERRTSTAAAETISGRPGRLRATRAHVAP